MKAIEVINQISKIVWAITVSIFIIMQVIAFFHNGYIPENFRQVVLVDAIVAIPMIVLIVITSLVLSFRKKSNDAMLENE